MERLNNLQVLRAFAALAVVFFHTGYRLFGLPSFGACGVDVFFVLSGFIMAHICARNPKRFFRRRLIRIIPLYWGATVSVFLVALVFPTLVKTTRPDLVELAKSLLFIPFEKSFGIIQPILFLGWTLNYEMFFYAALSVAIMISPRRASIAAAAIVIGVMLACSPFRHHSVIARFYSSGISLEFIAGMILHGVCNRVAIASRPILGLLGIASATTLMFLDATKLGLGLARVGLASSAFVLVFACVMLSRCKADTTNRTAILSGDASYVLYLVHPYIVAPAVSLLLYLGAFNGATTALLLALVTGLAILLHVHLERPATQLLSRLFL